MKYTEKQIHATIQVNPQAQVTALIIGLIERRLANYYVVNVLSAVCGYFGYAITKVR